MAKAGINLRQEDIQQYLATCRQAGIDASSLSVIKILHDDTDALLQTCLKEFSLVTGNIYRCMSDNSQLPIRPASQGGVPEPAEFIGWNENDNPQAYWDGWWKQVRTQRPNDKIHYGAPNVNHEWPRNDALQAELDFADWHIGSTFAPPPTLTETKVSVVTEVDVDPNRYSSLTEPGCVQELLNCCERCLQQGTDCYVWGLNQYIPDASFNAELLSGLIQLNQKYSQTTNQENNQVGLSIGPGVDQWIKDHQGTPLSNENYLSPNFTQSVTAVRIADDKGQPVEGILLCDKEKQELVYFSAA